MLGISSQNSGFGLSADPNLHVQVLIPLGLSVLLCFPFLSFLSMEFWELEDLALCWWEKPDLEFCSSLEAAGVKGGSAPLNSLPEKKKIL